MSEVKALVKAARKALDKGDYEEAVKRCEGVLQSGNEHVYLAHVMMGKALVQLDRRQEAKEQYNKAIEHSKDDLLAWKGLADLYSNHPPVLPEDKLHAIAVFTKVLDTISDKPKQLKMVNRLANLHNDIGQVDQALIFWKLLVSDGSVDRDIVLEGVVYILNHSPFTPEVYDVIKEQYSALDSNMVLRTAYIDGLYRWIKDSLVGMATLEEALVLECSRVCQTSSDETLVSRASGVLCQIELWRYIRDINGYSLHQPSSQQKEIFTSQCGTGNISCGQLIVLLSQGNVKEALRLIREAVTLNSDTNPCEYSMLATITTLLSHDYHVAVQRAKEGITRAHKCVKFLFEKLTSILRLCQVEALIMEGSPLSITQAIAIAQELYASRSHDSHVTYLYLRALVSANKIDEAEIIMSAVTCMSHDHHMMMYVQGIIAEARGNYGDAIKKYQGAIDGESLPLYHYHLGLCLWESSGDGRRSCYPPLIKAAQLDPNNPWVYLLLGKYQHHVAKDLKRAVKCYQRAIAIKADLTAAGMELADVLIGLNDQDGAIEVYKKVIDTAPVLQAKEAWLRVGLHNRRCGQYEEAIKCFMKVLHQDPTDYHVWECLGEAYLTRGSHTSSLKAFSKAIELHPSSLYCRYQVASIKHHVGLYREALAEYTAVLDVDSTYVPALKGRAETSLKLADKAIRDGFDGKAVDLVAMTLYDLTIAVKKRCDFVCLWKLLGDSCLILHPISPTIAKVSTPCVLLGDTGCLGDKGMESKIIEKEELYSVGLRMYKQALQLDQASTTVLHNMALTCYYLATMLADRGKESLAEEKMATSLKLIKKAISLSPCNANHWNVLGVVSCHKLVRKMALAQHCFIESLKSDPNVIAWTNLGSLYLTLGNVMLAHSAFEKAQSCDPGAVEGWAGDALVAEAVGKTDDTINLLRISSELNYHPESALGYAYWTCHTLSAHPSEEVPAFVHRAIVQARDGVVKYVLRNHDDSIGHNLLGLLYELEGVAKAGEKSLKRASELCCDGYHGDDVRINHARLLSCVGRSNDSLVCYDGIETDLLGLALVLFRLGRTNEALSLYEQMCDGSDRRAEVFLACAMCCFAEDNITDCKNYLFKVFQTPPPLVHGLISLAALACCIHDYTLLQATLLEIDKVIEQRPGGVSHCCYGAIKNIMYFLADISEGAESLEVIKLILGKLPAAEGTGVPSVLEVKDLVKGLRSNELLLALQNLVLVNQFGNLALSYLKLIVLKAHQETEALVNSPKHDKIKTASQKSFKTLQLWAERLHNANKR